MAKLALVSMAVAVLLFGGERVEAQNTSGENLFCIQVITHAQNSENGECQAFSTPCDVPEGWEVVSSCAQPINTIQNPYSSVIVESSGWHLLGAREDIKSLDVFDVGCVDAVYSYSNSSDSWSEKRGATSNINSIKAGEGYWLLTNNRCEIALEDIENSATMPALGENDVAISLDKEFVLKKGEMAIYADAADRRVEIFIDNINDSRCPADAICISQGEAEVTLRITGTLEILETKTLKIGQTTDTAQGYKVSLKDVKPYPQSSRDEQKEVYLELTK